MADEPYTNRELRLIHDELKEGMKDLKEDNVEILKQVKYTNGQVRKLWIVVTAIVFLLVGLGFKELLVVFGI